MCARSNGQLVCVKRRPSRTQAPTVTAAKTNANKRRRPVGECPPDEEWPPEVLVGADVMDSSEYRFFGLHLSAAWRPSQLRSKRQSRQRRLAGEPSPVEPKPRAAVSTALLSSAPRQSE